MDRFKSFATRISAIDQLSRLNSVEIDALVKRHPRLPADYLRFLGEFGYGDLGELQLHSGPSAAGNFFSDISQGLMSVIIFGDDKQGYYLGFDTAEDYRVVEVSPRGEVAKDVEPVLSDLLDGCFGGDT